jgi:hypothetical protein
MPQPALAGDTIAYAANSCRGCGTDIYLGNLSTGRSRRIVRLGIGVSPLTLHLSSTWLVWLQGRYPRAGWQLWVWSRATGRRRLIDASATEGGPAAPGYAQFSLSGSALAWARQDCRRRCTQPGPSTLRLLDLRGGSARVISHTTYACRPIAYPALTSTTLTWVGTPLSGYGCPAPITWTVISRDRHTGYVSVHEIHLSRNQLADSFVGDDGWEAWTEHLEFTNRDERVVLMNLRSGARRAIGSSGGFSPRLAGHTLAWTAGFGGSVWAMDLRSGKRYLLDHVRSSATLDTGPGIWLGQSWRNRVIWDESSINPNGGPGHEWLVAATVS